MRSPLFNARRILRDPGPWSPALGLLLLLAGPIGCGDKLEAHLGKFMPPASERTVDHGPPPDVYSLGEKTEVADRLAAMTFAEVADRLGAHRHRSEVKFRFSSSNHHYASLTEKVLIVQAANGDFRIMVDNDGGQGYELVSSGGQLWIRNRYGKFHARSELDGIHIKQRDAAYDAWGAMHRLFRGRLRFTKQGLARHFGRDGLRYAIGLSSDAPRLPGTPAQPQVPAGVTQYVYPVEPTPSDTDRWRDAAVPVSVSGSLVADLDTGVLLKADLTGRLAWTRAEEKIDLEVELHMEADGFGNPPAIPAPATADVGPLPERIQVDTHPLDFFFGKGFTATLGPAAGVARKSRAEQDAESDNPGGKSSKP